MSFCTICGQLFYENLDDSYNCRICRESYCSKKCFKKVCQPCIQCGKLIHIKDFYNTICSQDLPLFNWCPHLLYKYGTCCDCIEDNKYYYSQLDDTLILCCSMKCCISTNKLENKEGITLWNKYKNNIDIDFYDDSDDISDYSSYDSSYNNSDDSFYNDSSDNSDDDSSDDSDNNSNDSSVNNSEDNCDFEFCETSSDSSDIL